MKSAAETCAASEAKTPEFKQLISPIDSSEAATSAHAGKAG
jgi:hypothetical protein